MRSIWQALWDALTHDPMARVVVVVGAVSLGLTLHGIVVWARSRERSEKVGAHVADIIRRTGDASVALRSVRWGRGPTSRMIRAALRMANQSRGAIHAEVDGERASLLPPLRRLGRWQPLLASIAVLVSLVGCMLALVMPFGVYGDDRAQVLAARISCAYTLPALGLIFGMTGLLSHRLLQSLGRRLAEHSELATLHVLNSLDEMRPWLRLYGMRAPTETATYRDGGR